MIIVTGGQTGVDQAALVIAQEFNIPYGGWCPKGGLDENGVSILKKYPFMKETSTPNPDERTKLNIRDSHGTLIIVPCMPLPENIKDGTRLTITDVMRQNKPYLIISLQEKTGAIDKIRSWIHDEGIEILNVAGPRESSSPNIFTQSCDFFRELFDNFTPNCRL